MDLQKKLIYNGITLTLKTPFLSSVTLRLLENNIKKRIAEKEGSGVPYVKEIKGQFFANLLRQTIKNIQKGYISLEYIEGVKETLAGNQFLSDRRKKVREEFKKKYGIEPPGFVTISPTQKCNLQCTGCYAASHSHTVATLDYSVFKRLLTEQRDILGSNFVVISGGEPFIYAFSSSYISLFFISFNRNHWCNVAQMRHSLYHIFCEQCAVCIYMKKHIRKLFCNIKK